MVLRWLRQVLVCGWYDPSRERATSIRIVPGERKTRSQSYRRPDSHWTCRSPFWCHPLNPKSVCRQSTILRNAHFGPVPPECATCATAFLHQPGKRRETVLDQKNTYGTGVNAFKTLYPSGEPRFSILPGVGRPAAGGRGMSASRARTRFEARIPMSARQRTPQGARLQAGWRS